MIREKYNVDGSDEDFDNPMDAIKEAMYISQETMGEEVNIYRSVKYTGSNEWKRYTLNKVSVPKDMINRNGPRIEEDNFSGGYDSSLGQTDNYTTF